MPQLTNSLVYLYDDFFVILLIFAGILIWAACSNGKLEPEGWWGIILGLVAVLGLIGYWLIAIFALLLELAIYIHLHYRKKSRLEAEKRVAETRAAEKRAAEEREAKERKLKKWEKAYWESIVKVSPLMIDSCVWMNDTPPERHWGSDKGVYSDYWFNRLTELARSGDIKVRILSNIYDEIVNLTRSKDPGTAAKARKARNRIFELQKQTEKSDGFAILSVAAQRIMPNGGLYADPRIIQFMLNNPEYTLVTTDIDLQIRLKAISKQKGQSVKIINKEVFEDSFLVSNLVTMMRGED